jgi:LysM repeat protein
VFFSRTPPPAPAPPPPAPPPAKPKRFGWYALAACGVLAVASAGCKDRRLLDEQKSSTTKKSTTIPTNPATAVTRPATTAPPVGTTSSAIRNGTEYVVQSGDTIVGIAKKFGVSASAILAANNLTDPNRITVGQKLRIPGPSETGATVVTVATTQPASGPATTFPPGTETSIVTITVVVAVPKTTKP